MKEDLSDIQTAVELYNQALQIYITLRRNPEISGVYKYLGKIQGKKGNHEEATELFDKAAIYAKWSGLYYQEGWCTYWCGNGHFNSKQFNRSIPFLEAAIVLAKKYADTVLLSSAHNLLASSFGALGQTEEAIRNYEVVINLEQGRNKESLARAYFHLSWAYLKRSRLDEAMDAVDKTIENIEQALKLEQAGLCQCLKGAIYQKKNELLKAKTHMLLCREMVERSGGLIRNHGFAYLYLSKVYLDLGELDSAYFYVSKAIDFSLKVNDIQNLFDEYITMFRIQQKKGNHEAEYSYMLLGLNLAKRVGNSVNEIGFFSAIASHYTKTGNLKFAILYYDSALAVAFQLDAIDKVSIILRNKASVYNTLGEFNRALELVQDAVKLNEKYEMLNEMCMSYSKLSEIYFEMQDYEKCIEYASKALLGHQREGNRNFEAACYANIGLSNFSTGRLKEAEMNFNKALEIFSNTDEVSAVGDSYRNLARLYLQQGRIGVADSLITLSIDILANSGDIEGLGDCYLVKGTIEDKMGLLNAAIASVSVAVEIAKEKNFTPRIFDALEVMYPLYEKTGYWDSAFYTYLEYIKYRDSLHNIKVRNEITRKELQFDFEKKEVIFKLNEKLSSEQLRYREVQLDLNKRRIELSRIQLELKVKYVNLNKLKNLHTNEELQNQQMAADQRHAENRIHEERIILLAKQQQLQNGMLMAKVNERNAVFAALLLLGVMCFFVFRNVLNQRRSNSAIDAKNKEINATMDHLKNTQKQLVETENQRKIALEKTRIARDMNEEIGSGLSKIFMISEMLKNKEGEDDKYLAQVSQTAGDLVDSMSQIIWAMDPENDNLGYLFSYLRKFCTDFFDNSGIRCMVNIPVGVKAVLLSPPVKRNLFLVIKETLHNILKHSGATEVRISVVAEEEKVVIMISENGKGFDVQEASTMGNGLNNMSKRMQEISGSYKIESLPMKGSCTYLHVNMAVKELTV